MHKRNFECPWYGVEQPRWTTMAVQKTCMFHFCCCCCCRFRQLRFPSKEAFVMIGPYVREQTSYKQTASTLYRRNLKRSFICTVRPTVHNNPSRKRSFLQTLFKTGDFENAFFTLYCGQKTFWKGCFSKTTTSRWSRDFRNRVFPKHKSKMAGDCCAFKFLLRNVDENVLCVFLSERYFSGFSK